MQVERHDLAYLQQSANIRFMELSLAEPLKQKILHMLQQNVPLTVCRQDQVDLGQVKLAMSYFVAGQKYRFAVFVDQGDIAKITRPVALEEIVTQLPELTTHVLAEFLRKMQRLDCDVYVYGSYAYQYLTQEQYVNAASDLDLVLYPKSAQNLSEILSHLQMLQQQTDLRIDGEIKIHSDWHVSFNELIQVLSDPEQKIIAKGMKRIGLFTLQELLGWSHANTVVTN